MITNQLTMCNPVMRFLKQILFFTMVVASDHIAECGEIHDAVRTSNMNAVVSLIEKFGPQVVHTPITDGITPLHMATAMNNKPMTGLLISAGADINARTSGGFTPLHWAASKDAIGTAELLIVMGANINAKTNKGITPLHWAASKNAVNVLKLLILSGADIQTRTDTGQKPLHWAVMRDASEACTMLLFKEVTDEETTHGLAYKRKKPTDTSEWSSMLNETPTFEGEPLITQAVPRTQTGQPLIISLGSNVDMLFEWIPSLNIWFGKYEVTNEQYKRFKSSHSSMFREEFNLDDKHQPVVFVNWQQANIYCKWLTRNFSSYLPEGFEFRLPSEKEWTTTAQCGENRIYPWGNSMPPKYGNYSDSSLKTQIADWQGINNYTDGHIVTCNVADSGSNEWGVFGLAGNVWEWCNDWYDNSYSYKVLHGGSWDYDEEPMIRINARGFDRPDTRDDTIGFRVVAAPIDGK